MVPAWNTENMRQPVIVRSVRENSHCSVARCGSIPQLAVTYSRVLDARQTVIGVKRSRYFLRRTYPVKSILVGIGRTGELASHNEIGKPLSRTHPRPSGIGYILPNETSHNSFVVNAMQQVAIDLTPLHRLLSTFVALRKPGHLIQSIPISQMLTPFPRCSVHA
jgi:hypothetical protein